MEESTKEVLKALEEMQTLLEEDDESKEQVERIETIKEYITKEKED